MEPTTEKRMATAFAVLIWLPADHLAGFGVTEYLAEFVNPKVVASFGAKTGTRTRIQTFLFWMNSQIVPCR